MLAGNWMKISPPISEIQYKLDGFSFFLLHLLYLLSLPLCDSSQHLAKKVMGQVLAHIVTCSQWEESSAYSML